jgi:hypothetical protein
MGSDGESGGLRKYLIFVPIFAGSDRQRAQELQALLLDLMVLLDNLTWQVLPENSLLSTGFAGAPQPMPVS